MKHLINTIIVILLTIFSTQVYSQQNIPGFNSITATNLESHISFIASPLLKGRSNGGEEIEIAALYLATQAKLIGLKPANGNSFYHPYSVLEKIIDEEKTIIQVINSGTDTTKISKPIFQLVPTGPSDFSLEGEVVFAGYGIKTDKYNYNDFDGISTEGKILLVMNRAPSSEDGKHFLFEGTPWSSFNSLQAKLTTLIYTKAKAILFVTDPKSGFNSFDEQYPGIAAQISASMSLKGEDKPGPFQFPGIPKVLFIHRTVADELLKGSGKTLAELQKSIDSNLKPSSFELAETKISITEVTKTREKYLKNVAGYIEGRDPILKNEVVIYSSHYDHIGEQGGMINSGADDDASGCAALLSIAEAFSKLDKKPLRSILFLWVSGEEVGLFGSKSYVNNPLFPLNNTVVNLNMDMIGRVKSVADSTDETPMTGPETVFVITGNQSKELLRIAEKVDNDNDINFDYSLSGRNHPLQLFQRSDHFSFVRHDIPVLFFTTGLHSDYHSPGDVIEKIDFRKLEMITRTVYVLGYTIADNKKRLHVDNPYSSWGRK
jgi:hypothetical protein